MPDATALAGTLRRPYDRGAMSAPDDCLACQATRGEVAAPGGTIYDDGVWRVEHSLPPILLKGWLIAKPLRHVEHVGDLNWIEQRGLGQVLPLVSQALREGLDAKRVYLCSFGELVHHVHFYLIPRYEGMPASGLDVLGQMFSDPSPWASGEGEAIEAAARVRDRIEARRWTPDMIASALIEMAEADQRMRTVGPGDDAWDDSLDRVHTERLREMIDRIGWPTRAKVGFKAAQAAWLLAQHADHDRDLQRRCLELMRAAPAGDVLSSNLAYLEDRVRIGEGRSQMYGTQLRRRSDGEYEPLPLEDPQHVDELRASVGLGPLYEYVASVLPGSPVTSSSATAERPKRGRWR